MNDYFKGGSENAAGGAAPAAATGDAPMEDEIMVSLLVNYIFHPIKS